MMDVLIGVILIIIGITSLLWVKYDPEKEPSPLAPDFSTILGGLFMILFGILSILGKFKL